jgi:hypothetical protein
LFIARASSENDKAPETEKKVKKPKFPFGTQQDQVRWAAYAILEAMVNGKEWLRTPAATQAFGFFSFYSG